MILRTGFPLPHSDALHQRNRYDADGTRFSRRRLSLPLRGSGDMIDDSLAF